MEERASLSKSPNRELRKVEGEIRSVYSNRVYGHDDSQKEEKLKELNDIGLEDSYIKRLRAQREQIEVLKAQFEEKEEELAQKDRALARLEAELKSYIEFKQLHDRLLIKSEKDRFQLERLKKANVELADELTKIHKENLKDENKNLRLQLIEANAEIQSLATQVETGARLRESEIKEAEERENQFVQKLHSLKLEIEELQASKSELVRVYRDAEEEIGKLQSQKQNLERDAAALFQEAESVKQEKTELQQILVRLQKRETEMYEALQVLQNDKERILAFNELQVNELNSAVKKLKGQVSELKMRDKEKVVKMHDLEKEKDELRKTEELVKVEVIRCKAKIEDLQQKQVRSEEVIKGLRCERAQLERRLQSQWDRRDKEKKISQDVQRMRTQVKSSCMLEVDKIDSLIDEIQSRRKKY